MRSKVLVVLGALLIVIGLALSVLPKDWIEQTFAVDPDGGNGALELLLVLVPIVLGAALLVTVALRRARGGRTVRASSPPAGG